MFYSACTTAIHQPLQLRGFKSKGQIPRLSPTRKLNFATYNERKHLCVERAKTSRSVLNPSICELYLQWNHPIKENSPLWDYLNMLQTNFPDSLWPELLFIIFRVGIDVLKFHELWESCNLFIYYRTRRHTFNPAIIPCNVVELQWNVFLSSLTL